MKLSVTKAFSAAILLGTIPQAHAFPDLTKLARTAPAKAGAEAQDATCPDFSGTWVGHCTSSSGTTSDTTVVKQTGCTSIQADGQDSSPGSLKTTSNFLSGVAASVVEDYHWNSDYSALQLNLFVFAKADAQGIAQPAVSIPVSADMKLVGNQLVLTYQALGESGQCVYDKSQSR